jgi:hypothetical protein
MLRDFACKTTEDSVDGDIQLLNHGREKKKGPQALIQFTRGKVRRREVKQL